MSEDRSWLMGSADVIQINSDGSADCGKCGKHYDSLADMADAPCIPQVILTHRGNRYVQ